MLTLRTEVPHTPGQPLPKNVCYSVILREGDNLFGRDPPRRADLFSVVIDDLKRAGMISRHHATITKTGANYQLQILGLNGGLVNSIKVTSASLNDGDILTFGGVNPKTPVGATVADPHSMLVYAFSIRPLVSPQGSFDGKPNADALHSAQKIAPQIPLRLHSAESGNTSATHEASLSTVSSVPAMAANGVSLAPASESLGSVVPQSPHTAASEASAPLATITSTSSSLSSVSAAPTSAPAPAATPAPAPAPAAAEPPTAPSQSTASPDALPSAPMAAPGTSAATPALPADPASTAASVAPPHPTPTSTIASTATVATAPTSAPGAGADAGATDAASAPDSGSGLAATTAAAAAVAGGPEAKNTQQKMMDEMGKEFNCCICGELMVDPHTLTCSHSFCRTCITTWMDTNRIGCSCPVCRVPIKTPPIQVRTLNNAINAYASQTLSTADLDLRRKREAEEEAARQAKRPKPAPAPAPAAALPRAPAPAPASAPFSAAVRYAMPGPLPMLGQALPSYLQSLIGVPRYAAHPSQALPPRPIAPTRLQQLAQLPPDQIHRQLYPDLPPLQLLALSPLPPLPEPAIPQVSHSPIDPIYNNRPPPPPPSRALSSIFITPIPHQPWMSLPAARRDSLGVGVGPGLAPASLGPQAPRPAPEVIVLDSDSDSDSEPTSDIVVTSVGME